MDEATSPLHPGRPRHPTLRSTFNRDRNQPICFRVVDEATSPLHPGRPRHPTLRSTFNRDRNQPICFRVVDEATSPLHPGRPRHPTLRSTFMRDRNQPICFRVVDEATSPLQSARCQGLVASSTTAYLKRKVTRSTSFIRRQTLGLRRCFLRQIPLWAATLAAELAVAMNSGGVPSSTEPRRCGFADSGTKTSPGTAPF
ncbi:hypothetical protein TBK1r_59140 [Stieleria magnilauensis]|uniref:Uncharacterized protein n=1 Tax=Stieleria magnilauensis TaxID=2527963 RepID=A0ABX5XXX8_9BACT|nr:hypothetical protein TBK1r_59140 [Planctomycetes bacterium TBK1r]